MPTKDNGNQKVEELTTDELLEKIKADKKQLKKSAVFAFTALIAIIVLSIAWFVSNSRVSGTNGAVSVKSLPYCIATKETTKDANANYQTGLKEILDKFNAGKGSELKIGEDTYYVSSGGSVRIQVSEDNNLNNNEGNAMGGIAPGASGKITFYIIPREKGYKKFSLQMNLTAYQETGEERELKKIEDDGIKSLLKGHILFFRNYSEDTGYTDWIEKDAFDITSDKGFTQNEPIPITIYWVWPDYFQSFMKSGELFKNDDVINHFVSDMNLDTASDVSTPNSAKKYFYGFQSGQFKNENTDKKDWTFDSLNANQYLYLTECYNAADFQIGSNVKYSYLDFELR